jgi:Transposase DDE domain
MTTFSQSLSKNFAEVIYKVPKKISLYVGLLILSTERKNYAAIARSTGVNYRTVYIKKEDVDAYLEKSMQFLHLTIKNRATKANAGYLIIDFTLLRKQFSEHIPAVTYDYDGSEKRVNKGFSAGFVLWSDGIVTIPFDYSLWLRKKDAGALYHKKIDIVKQLIKLAQQYQIPFNEVRLDGVFSTKEMLQFLVAEGIHFTMRIAINRVITSKEGSFQLAHHPKFNMKRNQKYKVISALHKGLSLYFTAHKRTGKKGSKEVVFIVSDLQRTAKEHVKAYDQRWPGEKFFRTSKQSFGISHCQSTNQDKQKFHVFAVMVAYTVLQLMKVDQKKSSVEETLHLIRHQKKRALLFQYIDLETTFMN